MVRLRRRSEFQSVYAQGVKVSGQLLVVFALARSGEDCRLGITTTRRLGGAVVRNRARRRVRELFRRHTDLLAGVAADVVVNPRAGLANAEWADLEEDYVRCLRKVRRRLAEPGS